MWLESMPGSTCRRGNPIPLLSQMVTQRESRRSRISAPFLPSSWLPFSPSSIPSGLLIWATHFWWMLLLFINVQKSCPSFSFSLPSWKLRLVFPVHSEDAYAKEVNASALLTHPGLGPVFLCKCTRHSLIWTRGVSGSWLVHMPT